MMLVLFVALAAPYTAEAFEELRRHEAARIASGAPVDDDALAASLAAASGDADALMRFAARLVAIGDREPERAMRWIPRLPAQNEGNYIPRARATEFLFRRWVRREPKRAADAALQFWRDGHGHPVSDLLHEWAQFAPRDAIAWVQALDDRERTPLAAYEQLLGVLPSVDHRIALELAESVPERYSFALVGAYGQILAKLVESDVEAAVSAYNRYEARAPADAKKCVAAMSRAWGERQPEKAVVFIESRLPPDEPRRYAALQGVAVAWAKKNPRAGADLSLRAMREQRLNRAMDRDDHHHGPRQDPLTDIVVGWAAKSRGAAVKWVEAIGDEDVRDHLLHALGVARPKPQPPPKPQPSRTLANVGSPTDIRYGLIDYYGDIFYCDPDMYPVHDSGAEERSAIAMFPKIAAAAAHYAAIMRRLGLADAESPGAKLKIYREHKKLAAVELESSLAGWEYELRLNDSVVRGRVEGSTIIETSRTKQLNTCPVCLSDAVRIDTPSGAVPITELRAGALVWTRDASGARVAAPVLRLGSTPSAVGHRVVRLVLRDGRTVLASPRHPLADGRALGELEAGAFVDGARIESVELVPYAGESTWDLLPDGDTGIYWADGVPLGSTLLER
jgi:hypothetical protein